MEKLIHNITNVLVHALEKVEGGASVEQATGVVSKQVELLLKPHYEVISKGVEEKDKKPKILKTYLSGAKKDVQELITWSAMENQINWYNSKNPTNKIVVNVSSASKGINIGYASYSIVKAKTKKTKKVVTKNA